MQTLSAIEDPTCSLLGTILAGRNNNNRVRQHLIIMIKLKHNINRCLFATIRAKLIIKGSIRQDRSRLVSSLIELTLALNNYLIINIIIHIILNNYLSYGSHLSDLIKVNSSERAYDASCHDVWSLHLLIGVTVLFLLFVCLLY